MSSDTKHMKKVLDESIDVKIVGIIKPSEEGIVNSNNVGLVGYRHDLVTELIKRINETEIVKEQKEKKNINVFTNQEFSSKQEFDYSNMTPEQIKYISSLSNEELAAFMNNYAANMNQTYENNLKKLGVADLDNPDKINIFPVNFEAKEKIEEIIDKYNEGKDENEQITYTDRKSVV